MKTLIRVLNTVILSTLAILAFSCGKSGSNNTNPAPYYGNNGGYYMTNGMCYAPGGQQVATTYCANTGTGGYYLNGGICYGPNGQQYPTTYCTNTGTGVPPVGGTTTPGSCYGYYYYYYYGSPQMVTCMGANCYGATLYQYPTGQIVTCQ